MVRTNQGGSILGFIVIGGVLALLLVGGAYFVRNNLGGAEDKGKEVIASFNEDDTKETTEDETSSDENQAGEEKDAEKGEVKDEAKDAPAEPLPADGQLPEGGQNAQTPSNLPETGPADILLSGLMLGGISAAVVVYMRSRDSSVSL